MSRRWITRALRFAVWIGLGLGATVPSAGAAVTAVSLGSKHSCALDDGAVKCWGGTDPDVDRGQATVPTSVDGAGEALAVAAGRFHTCAIRSTGAVVCWGEAYGGVTSPPAAVNGTSGTATAIAAHDRYSCAIQAGSGAVVCWGSNGAFEASGRLSPPAAVNGTSGGATAIALGRQHACAIRSSDGGVTCWGSDYAGKATPPASVASGALAIAAGTHSSCAIRSTGAVVCWGSWRRVKSADETWTQSIAVPSSVDGSGSTATVLAMLSLHACAVRASSNAAVCWAHPNYPARSNVPPALDGTSGTASIVGVGSEHGCAVQAGTGTLICWGRDWESQVSGGSLANCTGSAEARVCAPAGGL